LVRRSHSPESIPGDPMNSACLTLTVALTCSLVPADDKSEWKEYKSAEGRFKVLFPVAPEVGKVPGQKPELHSVVVKRQAVDGLGYMCYWSIREEAFKNGEEEAAFLKGLQEGAVKAGKGVLDGEKEIELDGLRGREFFVKLSGSDYVIFRAYVNGKR